MKVHGVKQENHVRIEIDDSDQPVFRKFSGVNEKNLFLGVRRRFSPLPFFLEPIQKFRSGSVITPKPVANPYDRGAPGQRRLKKVRNSFQVKRVAHGFVSLSEKVGETLATSLCLPD